MKINLNNDIKQNNLSSNININNSAFLTNSQGDERTEVAARQKKSRDVKRLKEMILDKKKTDNQIALVLHTVLTDPDLEKSLKLLE